MNGRPSTDISLKDLLEKHKKEIMLSMNCHAIGRIEEFDSSSQTCTVKINYLKTRIIKNEQGRYVENNYEYPLLLDCPTLIYSGGLSGLTMPIKKGDSCLVLFNDRDIDNWYEGSNSAPLASSRLHSLSDGIVFVGLNSQSTKLNNYDADNPHLFNEDTSIKVKSDKVLIENSSDKLGVILGELIDAIANLQTNPVSTGSPASLSSTTINEINAAKSKIQGLLE